MNNTKREKVITKNTSLTTTIKVNCYYYYCYYYYVTEER